MNRRVIDKRESRGSGDLVCRKSSKSESILGNRTERRGGSWFIREYDSALASRSARSNSLATRFHIDEPRAREGKGEEPSKLLSARRIRNRPAIGKRQLDGFNPDHVSSLFSAFFSLYFFSHHTTPLLFFNFFYFYPRRHCNRLARNENSIRTIDRDSAFRGVHGCVILDDIPSAFPRHWRR